MEHAGENYDCRKGYCVLIISKAPLRVSFFGGGTDLEWFYRENSGMVVSTSINKHVYISCHPMFDSQDILLKYSEMERVTHNSEIKHRIFRKALQMYDINGVDIGVSSDVPAGTGLGSSSSFTVALLQTLRQYKSIDSTAEVLAKQAVDIEINLLQQTMGKQDQYAAAFGGLNRIFFQQDNQVIVEPINISKSALERLNQGLICVRVGGVRVAAQVLEVQYKEFQEQKRLKSTLQELLEFTRNIPNSVFEDLNKLGLALNEAWRLKKSSSTNMSNSDIDELISYGLKKGAAGAKLLGAGQGGFVLFVVEPEAKSYFLKSFQTYPKMQVTLETQGVQTIYNNQR